MKPKLLKSIRFKLTFIALVSVFIITLLIVYSDVKDTENRLIDTQKEKAVLMSDIIKQSIMLLMLENRWKDVQDLLEDITKANPELDEVRIFHPLNGKVIASADIKDIGKHIYHEDWNKFVNKLDDPFVINKKGSIFATRVTPIPNKPACYKCHPPQHKVLGVLDVEVSLSVAHKSIIESTYRHFLGLVLGFIVITVIFIVVGERLISAPLRKLTKVMETVENGDLSVRVKDISKDEFGYLSKSFNRMIEALQSAQQNLETYHRQQMEQTSKLASLGQIVSGIAHEIKNPLAGISCAVQVFHSEMKNDDPQKEVVSEVLNQVTRLDKIVKDLLSYAKPKAPRYIPTKINEVIDKALFFLYPEAKKLKVTIDLKIQEGLPEILIDPDQIQQVFMNITVNALHAMQSGGTVSIKASVTECSELKDTVGITGCDKAFVISFHDTGQGIEQDELVKIFEPFFTKKTVGTGLGLSICRRIIEEHGGKITVSSALGDGSIFTVYLPIRNSTET
ncbi:MAG: HAMP domain-containing protein [Nitrospirae bacterium]|nr:HAMP domain-containing protein [Nitrospirota bacterium]